MGCMLNADKRFFRRSYALSKNVQQNTKVLRVKNERFLNSSAPQSGLTSRKGGLHPLGGLGTAPPRAR